MERRADLLFWGALAAAAVLLIAGTWSVPLIDPDEARFARTSVEMAESGDLVVPTFEDSLRLVKPPLLHWIQVPLFRQFGAGEFAARLPSVLATLAMAFVVGWVALRRFGHEGAAWAAAILTTSPLVIAIGRLGTLDALLAVHVLAVVALDIAEPEEVGPLKSLAAGGLMGMAFLAKGPVGVILPILIVLAGRTASGRAVLPSWSNLGRMVAAWCAIVLPWGLVFVRRIGGGATLEILRREVWDRALDGTSHSEPPWYYAAVMVLGFLPWIVPAAAAMVRVLLRRGEPRARTALYAGAGLLVGLLFFSLFEGKLPNYLLPLAPLVAILVTWELGQALDSPNDRRLVPGVMAGVVGALGATLAVASFLDLPPEILGTVRWSAAGYVLAFPVAFVGAVRHRPRAVYGATLFANYVLLLALVLTFLPALADRRSAKPLIDAVPVLRADRPTVVVDMQFPSLTFYLDRVPEHVDLDGVDSRMEIEDRALFVFDHRDLDRVAPGVRARLREVGRYGKFRVLDGGTPGG